MSQESAEELVEDAQIDGLKGHSRFGGFVRGLLLGGVLTGGALLALTLATPLPDHLPGVGRVEVVSAPARPAAPEAPAAPAAEESGPQATAATGQDEEAATPATAPAADEASAAAPAAPAVEAADQPDQPASDAVVVAGQDAATERATTDTPADRTAALSDEEAVPQTGASEDGGDGVSPVAAETAPAPEAEAGTDATTATAAVPGDAAALADGTGQDTDADAAPVPTLSLAGPALAINARAFKAPEGAPLLAVILEDAGNGSISADALGLMTMPLTLAVRPERDGARDLARTARAAGHEILTQLPMAQGEGPAPTGALTRSTPPEDLQAITTRYLATLDMSIGATAPEGARLINDQRAMEAVLAPVSVHGFAWLDLKAGIGSAARRVAGATGLRYAESNRFVAAGATEDQVYQMLEGAAFQARRQGSAVVAISTSQVALKALLRWGLERGGQEVWFAPLSAVIDRQAEG